MIVGRLFRYIASRILWRTRSFRGSGGNSESISKPIPLQETNEGIDMNSVIEDAKKVAEAVMERTRRVKILPVETRSAMEDLLSFYGVAEEPIMEEENQMFNFMVENTAEIRMDPLGWMPWMDMNPDVIQEMTEQELREFIRFAVFVAEMDLNPMETLVSGPPASIAFQISSPTVRFVAAILDLPENLRSQIVDSGVNSDGGAVHDLDPNSIHIVDDKLVAQCSHCGETGDAQFIKVTTSIQYENNEEGLGLREMNVVVPGVMLTCGHCNHKSVATTAIVEREGGADVYVLKREYDKYACAIAIKKQLVDVKPNEIG